MGIRKESYDQIKAALFYPRFGAAHYEEEMRSSQKTEMEEVIADILTEIAKLRKQVTKLQGQGAIAEEDETSQDALIAELKADLISSAEESLRLRQQVLSAEERLLSVEEKLLAASRENFELTKKLKAVEDNSYKNPHKESA